MTKPKGLKLVNPLSVAEDPTVRDATLGGLGMDWTTPPTALADAGLEAWRHLAHTYRDEPTRFREADRYAVASYCMALEMQERAAAELRDEGLRVEGRSESDKRRSKVRNPAWGMYRDASNQVRQWGNVLGLDPSSRYRMNIAAPLADGGDNPFIGRPRDDD